MVILNIKTIIIIEGKITLHKDKGTKVEISYQVPLTAFIKKIRNKSLKK